MMRRTWMMLVGLLVMISLMVAGCGGDAPSPAAPPPAAPGAGDVPAEGLGDLPRHETLIADILTGRVGSPDDFNNWV
ncbi:hypothetical protein V6O07_17935, partial [Arthrospira platensis SPKY2]